MTNRELDALVAEKIMGLKDPQWIEPCFVTYPNYSTDISAAWEVVEKMTMDDNSILCAFQMSRWSLYTAWFSYKTKDGQKDFKASTPTAPKAICLASLKAVGVDVLQKERLKK